MIEEKSTDRDKAVIDEYVQVADLSSEALIRDPIAFDQFLESVNSRLSAEATFDDVELKKRLETIRKNGDLPKKFRAYNGRDLSRPTPK